MKYFLIPTILCAFIIGCDRTTYDKKVKTDTPNGSTEYHKTVKQSDDGSSKSTTVEKSEKK